MPVTESKHKGRKILVSLNVSLYEKSMDWKREETRGVRERHSPPKGNDYTKTLMFYDAFIADWQDDVSLFS